MKNRVVYICQQCAFESSGWLGKCPGCGTWNSLVETAVSTRNEKLKVKSEKLEKPLKLTEVKSIEKNRLSTGMKEFDRVLGGGIVSGSVILLAGEPGIGKSTLLLQIVDTIEKREVGNGKRDTEAGSERWEMGKEISRQKIPLQNPTSHIQLPSSILYICGEESPEQIKLRSQRMGIKGQNLLLLAQTDADTICTQIEEIKPLLVIIDSIQTLTIEDLSGSAGSVGQVRECSSCLAEVAKRLGVPIFLVGHVTKEGSIAGPMVLEHLVDTVLFLEGERSSLGRTLRSLKNRFGPTDEVGVFQMVENGLAEVKNPSELFLHEAQLEAPGSVIAPILEGTRPILVEIQALVTPTNLAFPRRIASGFDVGRLNILSAVVAKRLSLGLYNCDIMINIPGGLKLKDPGADLGVALAIISSFKNKSLPKNSFAFGEVGLLGEIRKVLGEEKRVKEAKRLGFNQGITPQNYKSLFNVTKTKFA